MSDAQASEAARSLARIRWGSTVVERAAGIVIARADELDESTRAAIGAAITEEHGDD
jgi:hypothetical protein